MIALLAFVVLVDWAFTGIQQLEQNERGVIVRFGRPLRVVEPGMHLLLPWPIDRLERVSSEVLWTTIGYKDNDELKGWRPTESEVQWLTGDTNIVELQATVHLSILDPVAYLFGIDTGSSGPESIVRQATEAVLTDLVAHMTVDDVLSSGKTQLQIEAIPRIQAFVDEIGLGVRIAGLNIERAAPPAAVIRSFNEVQSARSDMERRITEATSYRNRTLPESRAIASRTEQEARAYATETVSRAKGEAESFRKLVDAVLKSPDQRVALERVWLEKMKAILAAGEKLIIQPGTDEQPTRVYIAN